MHSKTRFLRFGVVVLLVLSAAVAFGKNLREPKLLTWDPPRYPFLAAADRVQGTVNLRLTLAHDGRVQKVEVLGGRNELMESAVEAGRKLIFDCDGCVPGQQVTRDIAFKYQIKGKPTEERRIKVKKRGEKLLEVTLTPPLEQTGQ